MDLLELISLLMQAQNRRWVEPDMRGKRNYNKTPGNPPVALEEGGWLRSQFPYETGEGGPAGRFNDDGRSRTLEELFLMDPRYQGWLSRQYKQSSNLLEDLAAPPDGAAMDFNSLHQMGRNRRNVYQNKIKPGL